MPVSLSGLIRGVGVPALARPAFWLAMRLGLISREHAEAALHYVEHLDEAVSWWPPPQVLFALLAVLLLSLVLLILAITRFIRQFQPAWLCWLGLAGSVASFWSPPFILARHYAAKLRLLYRFALQEQGNIERIAMLAAAEISELGRQAVVGGTSGLRRIRGVEDPPGSPAEREER